MNNIIWIETSCLNYYRFINRLSYLRLNILEIKKDNDKVYLKIYSKDYDKFKKYLVSYKININKKLGILSIIDIIKSNYIFLISVLIGLIIYFIGQNLVIKINIIHENKEIRELLTDELDNYGIKVLSFKKSYQELYKIREEILDKYPTKLDWIEFEMDGMVLNLKVEERVITKKEENNNICNIIAKKEGIITNIKVESGEANVMINDHVTEGDILIKGIINYNNEDVRMTCAKGKVFATTWWTVKVKVPLNANNYNYTGKKRYNLTWEFNNLKKDVFKSRINNYESKYILLFDLVGFRIYLKNELEIEKSIKKLSKDEALNIGINKAIDNLKTNLGEFDTIIDKKVLKKSINDSTMDIEIFVVVNELISKEQIISKEGIDK